MTNYKPARLPQSRRCYDKECACSELAAFVDCYYEYCPGYGGADGGGVVNTFTCVGTRPVSGFPTASSSMASSKATDGNTERIVTAAPTPTSTGGSGSTNDSGSNSDQNATSTNDASKLFASAGVLLGSFIGVLALL